MKIVLCLWALAMIVMLALPSLVRAAIPATYTNANYWESEHDKPVQFYQDTFGNFYGTTATGKAFSQTSVENTLSVRLQKFMIDEAFFYVSDKGIIRAKDDMMALSIYLAKEA